MSETRAKDFKAPSGPTAAQRRLATSTANVSKKREAKFELGRRRILEEGASAFCRDDYVKAMNSFLPEAVLQGDKPTCLAHLQLLDKIVQFQRGKLIEDVNLGNDIAPLAKMRLTSNVTALIPRLVVLLEQDPDCQVYCARLLTNMTASMEAESWVAMMMQTDLVDAFDRILANSNHYRPDMASATVTAIISCIGNICIQDQVYREAFFPRFSTFLLGLCSKYSYLVKDVAFVAHAMMIRYPLPPHPIVEQWKPFILGLVLNTQPIADDVIASYLAHVGVLALACLTSYESAYRLIFCNEHALVRRLQEFVVSESIYTPVRAVSCDVLNQLAREPSKHADLLQLGVLSTLVQGLYVNSPDVRVFCATGLETLAKNPAMTVALSEPKPREALVFHAKNGNAESRVLLGNVLMHVALNLPSVCEAAGCDLVGSWLDAGLVSALTCGLSVATRPVELQEAGLAALEALFKLRRRARDEFEQEGGDELLNTLFMHSTEPTLSKCAERLLDSYFHGMQE